MCERYIAGANHVAPHIVFAKEYKTWRIYITLERVAVVMLAVLRDSNNGSVCRLYNRSSSDLLPQRRLHLLLKSDWKKIAVGRLMQLTIELVVFRADLMKLVVLLAHTPLEIDVILAGACRIMLWSTSSMWRTRGSCYRTTWSFMSCTKLLMQEDVTEELRNASFSHSILIISGTSYALDDQRLRKKYVLQWRVWKTLPVCSVCDLSEISVIASV